MAHRKFIMFAFCPSKPSKPGLLPDTGRMIFPSPGKIHCGVVFFWKAIVEKLPAHPNTPSLELLPVARHRPYDFSGLEKFIGEASLLQLQPHLWPDRLDVSCSPPKIHHVRLLPIQAHKAKATAKQGPNDFSRSGKIHSRSPQAPKNGKPKRWYLQQSYPSWTGYRVHEPHPTLTGVWWPFLKFSCLGLSNSGLGAHALIFWHEFARPCAILQRSTQMNLFVAGKII